MARPPFKQKISFDDAPQAQLQPRGGAPPPPAKSPSYSPNVPTLGYEEAGYAAGGSNYPGFSSASGADVRRKKSMVRPDRERIEPGHRQFHYREHATEDNVRVQPSSEYYLRWTLDTVLTRRHG
jgi:chitin synthase